MVNTAVCTYRSMAISLYLFLESNRPFIIILTDNGQTVPRVCVGIANGKQSTSSHFRLLKASTAGPGMRGGGGGGGGGNSSVVRAPDS